MRGPDGLDRTVWTVPLRLVLRKGVLFVAGREYSGKCRRRKTELRGQVYGMANQGITSVSLVN